MWSGGSSFKNREAVKSHKKRGGGKSWHEGGINTVTGLSWTAPFGKKMGGQQ